MSDSVRSDAIPPLEEEGAKDSTPSAPKQAQRSRRPESGHRTFPFASADVLFGPSWRVESGS